MRRTCPGPWLHLTLAVGACAAGSSLCAGAQTPSLPLAPQPQGTLAQPGQVRGTARVTGEILSADGALLPGVHLLLAATAPGSAAVETVSGTDGRFLLDDLTAGAYTLTATLPGFETVSQTLTLGDGEYLELPATSLGLATVNISVDALTPEQAALQEVKAEETQRLVGVLPNFFVSYNWTAQPLTPRLKFRLATKNAFDPGNLALVATVAGVQQAADAFPGYGQGAAGYGKRYGADFGNLVVGTYMGGAVLPSLFRQDPRYFYKGTGTVRSRVLYALSRSVITRGDNGHEQPNFAGILGDLSAGAISNLYYPASDRQGAKLFLENGVLAIAGDAMNALVQEFFFSRYTSRGKDPKAAKQP